MSTERVLLRSHACYHEQDLNTYPSTGRVLLRESSETVGVSRHAVTSYAPAVFFCCPHVVIAVASVVDVGVDVDVDVDDDDVNCDVVFPCCCCCSGRGAYGKRW